MHENLNLYQRGRRWHFMRRVPELFRSFDRRHVIRRSLRTASVLVARARRDVLIAADDDYWAAMVAIDSTIAPFIEIRPRKERNLKTHSSIRDIPLAGVALEAMRSTERVLEMSRSEQPPRGLCDEIS